MEPIFRGIIEKGLDEFLKADALSERVNVYQKYQTMGLVNSLEDAIFGALAEVIMNMLSLVKISTGSKITLDEAKELYDIVENRSLEIRSKIRQATSL
jgi:hypothetical protein